MTDLLQPPIWPSRAKVRLTVGRVCAAESLGHQDFDRLPEEIFASVAEQLLRLTVDEHDAPVVADDDHRIRSCLHKRAHPCAGRPLFPEAFQGGHVLDVGGQEPDRALIVLDRPNRHGDVYRGAALLLPEGL